MPWYQIVLCVHIIAVISWMAGILYLYRLFVYHVEEHENVVKARFIVMEERLTRIIMLPAMIVALLFGIFMLVMNPALLKYPWMHTKLLLVAFLLFMSHYGGKLRRQLQDGTCKKTSRQLRFLNEVPTLLMIGIVVMVILRPF